MRGMAGKNGIYLGPKGKYKDEGVVLSKGIFCKDSVFLPIALGLSMAGREVIMPRYRMLDKGTLDPTFKDDCISAFKDLDSPNRILLGLSAGAFISMVAAMEEPLRFEADSLLLYAPVADMEDLLVFGETDPSASAALKWIGRHNQYKMVVRPEETRILRSPGQSYGYCRESPPHDKRLSPDEMAMLDFVPLTDRELASLSPPARTLYEISRSDDPGEVKSLMSSYPAGMRRMFDSFSPVRLIERKGVPSCPVTIYHGTEDHVIPLEHGYRLADAINGAGGTCVLREMRGFGHAEVKDYATFISALPELARYFRAL